MKKVHQSMSDLRYLNLLLNFAVEAAHKSGKVLMKYFGGKLRVSEKKDAGLVTNADFESQENAIRILKTATPFCTFLAEEAGLSVIKTKKNLLRQKIGTPEKRLSNKELSRGVRWIIDPLDGTTNFVHGFPMFCVSIAAEWNNELCVGVIYHPVLDQTYYAVRGNGAWMNDHQIQVSKTQSLKSSLLTTGFTYQKHSYLKDEVKVFEKLSGVARAIRRPGSAALDLAYTACGVFDGFWERNLSPWDTAAGVILVEEAGGKVTDYQNQPFDLFSKEILATNSNIHRDLLKTIGKKA